jgi:hypothetical protein
LHEINLSVILTKLYVLKAYGGVNVWIHVFLNFVQVGGEWSGSLSGSLTPKEKAPGTHGIGGWEDPRTGLDDMKKWEFVHRAVL